MTFHLVSVNIYLSSYKHLVRFALYAEHLDSSITLILSYIPCAPATLIMDSRFCFYEMAWVSKARQIPSSHSQCIVTTVTS